MSITINWDEDVNKPPGKDIDGLFVRTPEIDIDEVIVGFEFYRSGNGIRSFTNIFVSKVKDILEITKQRIVKIPENGERSGGGVFLDRFMCDRGYVLTGLQGLSNSNMTRLWVEQGKLDATDGIINRNWTEIRANEWVGLVGARFHKAGNVIVGWEFTHWPVNPGKYDGIKWIPKVKYSDIGYAYKDLKNSTVKKIACIKDAHYGNYIDPARLCNVLVDSDGNIRDDQLVELWCKDNLDDPFCACYKPIPDSVNNDLRQFMTKPRCWNATCAAQGYMSRNLLADTSACPNITICSQNINAQGNTGIEFSENIITQDCSVQSTPETSSSSTDPTVPPETTQTPETSSSSTNQISLNNSYVSDNVLYAIIFVVVSIIVIVIIRKVLYKKTESFFEKDLGNSDLIHHY